MKCGKRERGQWCARPFSAIKAQIDRLSLGRNSPTDSSSSSCDRPEIYGKEEEESLQSLIKMLCSHWPPLFLVYSFLIFGMSATSLIPSVFLRPLFNDLYLSMFLVEALCLQHWLAALLPGGEESDLFFFFFYSMYNRISSIKTYRKWNLFFYRHGGSLSLFNRLSVSDNKTRKARERHFSLSLFVRTSLYRACFNCSNILITYALSHEVYWGRAPYNSHPTKESCPPLQLSSWDPPSSITTDILVKLELYISSLLNPTKKT